MSVFAPEYPSYGPAEGEASEESVNDNLRTAYGFLRDEMGYPAANIILMGYSIGTGACIQLAYELCVDEAQDSCGALVLIAPFLSVKHIVQDLKGSVIVNVLAGAISNRWNSLERIGLVTCPSLFVHGLKDTLIPVEHSQKLFFASGAGQKRLKVCVEADHTNFEEPTDTIEPIAIFLGDVLMPETRQRELSNSVPVQYYICPRSVFEREREEKRKMSRGASPDPNFETGESSGIGAPSSALECVADSFTDTFSWLWGASTTMGKGCSNSMSGGVNLCVSSLAHDEFDSMGHDEEELRISERSKKTKTSTVKFPKSPAFVAMNLLSEYFAALNSRNASAAAALLDVDVSVEYEGDEASSRDWRGRAKATQKFVSLFAKRPSYSATFQLVCCEYQEERTSIKASCNFSCSATGFQASHMILYTIVTGESGAFIVTIRHLQS